MGKRAFEDVLRNLGSVAMPWMVIASEERISGRGADSIPAVSRAQGLGGCYREGEQCTIVANQIHLSTVPGYRQSVVLHSGAATYVTEDQDDYPCFVSSVCSAIGGCCGL